VTNNCDPTTIGFSPAGAEIAFSSSSLLQSISRVELIVGNAASLCLSISGVVVLSSI
jgi:hypothetical protein